jgi:hypothetical protein
VLPATRLPQLTRVRVLTPGGPYAPGSVLSLAFVDPVLGRLCRHVEAEPDLASTRTADGPIVPDAIFVALLTAAPPYDLGEVLTLSFVDPCVVRIQPIPNSASATTAAKNEAPAAPAAQPEQVDSRPPAETPDAAALLASRSGQGVRVRLEWTAARVARFASLVDKLFAVDRLGWYRHVLAVRLLLPDELTLVASDGNEEAARRLRSLKMAATEALGTPLLAALMPNFSVDSEWLQSIETPALARTAADLRDFIRPHLDDQSPGDPVGAPRSNYGPIRAAELKTNSGASVEAFLPLLVPAGPASDEVGRRLIDYRTALIELFGQTAHASLAVRTTRMTQANPALDDRLAALAGAVQQAAGQLAVA